MTLKRLIWTAILLLALFAFRSWAGEIHEAAERGDMAVLQKLLQADPSRLNAPGDKGRTPLHLAAFNGNTGAVEFLIQQGADVNQRETFYDLTPLHMAAWKGHAAAVGLLLDAGADLTAREKDNETPLYYAATSDSTETVDLLLAKGADLNDTESKAGNTVLSLAIERGQNKTAEHLIHKGADVQVEQDRGTLLHLAAWRGTQPLIDLLVSKGLAVDAANKFGITPLFLAGRVGNAEAVKALLARGARTDLRDGDGRTPLLGAVMNGHKEVVGLLLQAGADPNAAAGGGPTPLHVASFKGCGDIVSLLIAKGADLNAGDGEGMTPLDYALKYARKTCAGLLTAKGARAGQAWNGRKPMDDFNRTLQNGEAQVWYLEHSGWLVRTRRHVLIFDYPPPRVPGDDPSLANGAIVPRELKHENVTVFVSHGHGDHYNPAIFEWRKAIGRIHYVLGFKPDTREEYTLIEPMQKMDLDGLEVTATASNDGGVAFFVRADGVGIYHAGDHANRKPEVTEDFAREIDVLARNGLKPDLLFAPVSGCGFGDPESVRKGVYYTVEKLAPRAVFPMHSGGAEWRLKVFAEKARENGVKGEFLTPAHPGDHFLVQNGPAEQLAAGQ